MKKILIVLAIVAGLVIAFSGASSAQDELGLTADPPSVEAAGEAEITFTGTGFTVAELFMTPCPGADGDIANLADPLTQCDLDNPSVVAPTAGEAWTVTVTYDIPEIGLLVVASDLAQTEQAFTTVTVGAPEGSDDGGEETDGGDEAADSGDEAADSSDEAADSSDEAADGEEEELANTGTESDMLLVVGITVLVGGAFLALSTRRFRQL